MLDYRLDAETEALRKTVREFAQEVIAPQIGEFYERDEFPTQIVRQMGELGLFGLPFRRSTAARWHVLDLCVALEELVRRQLDGHHGRGRRLPRRHADLPVRHRGQKQEWLPPLLGQAWARSAMTEPGGGSDAGATKHRRKLEDGHWVINGSKAFITNMAGRRGHGHGGDRHAADGHKEISAIIVPSGRRASSSGSGTRRSAGTPRTPASCRSPTCRCRRKNLG